MSDRAKKTLFAAALIPIEASLLIKRAIADGDAARLRELLALGLDPNGEALSAMSQPMGVSFVIHEGDRMPLECLKALLEAGANPDAPRLARGSALLRAVQRLAAGEALTKEGPVADRVELLLRAGADPEGGKKRPGSVMKSAAVAARMYPEQGLRVARALLAAGGAADIGERAHNALRIACEGERLELVELLLGAGADPTLRGPGGKTPIEMMSARSESPRGEAIRAALIRAMESRELRGACERAAAARPVLRV